jgi:hypothetical protein
MATCFTAEPWHDPMLLSCPPPCLPAVPLQELPANLSAEEHAFINMLNEVR